MTNVVPAKLAYKCYQPSSGKEESSNPVIFLHGGTTTKESFHDLPQVIADGAKRKVFALDARNHGDSEYTDVFNFDLNVVDLFHFMDTHKIQKAALVGHSMGGVTAINAALKKPERIEMIFVEDAVTNKIEKYLLDTTAIFMESWATIVRSVPKDLNDTDAVRFAVDVLYRDMPSDMPRFPTKEVFCKYYYSFKRSADGFYEPRINKDALVKAFTDSETLMNEPSGQYDGPAYFLYGTLSAVRVWEKEDHIKKHFPNAELIEFENATHEVHLMFPEKFASTILQRLKQ